MPIIDNFSVWDFALGFLGSAIGAGVTFGALNERTKQMLHEVDELKKSIVYQDTFEACQKIWSAEIAALHTETKLLRDEMHGMRGDLKEDTRQILGHLLNRKTDT
jgi:hypothetical protein